jgi:hypothetical protein
MVGANTNTLATPAVEAQAGEAVVIYYDAPGAVNPLAPTGTAVPLDGAFIEHGEAHRSDHWRKRRGCAVRGTGTGLPGSCPVSAIVPAGVGQGDRVPEVLCAGGQTSPPVTTAGI